MLVDLIRKGSGLDQLNQRAPLAEKLESIHKVVRRHLPFVDRIAADVYEPGTETLKTFVESNGGANPLLSYQTTLEEVPVLREILDKQRPQIMVQETVRPESESRRRRSAHLAFASTCAIPMYSRGEFFGFLYFNSQQAGVFEPHALHALDIFGHLIALVIIDELSSLRVMAGVIKAARAFTVERDQETGAHIDRVAHYVRIIATELAPTHGFGEEFINQLFMFAPLHDLGKLAIPDSILLKPGKLSTEEFEIIKSHAQRGRQLVDELIADFGLDGMDGLDTLRNIAEFHHEALNGSGYPLGLSNDEIPIEARIIAVADVFDALTSKRPYKPAYSNEDAFAMLEQMSGTKLDPECIRALAKHKEEIPQIQVRFSEDVYG